MCLNSGSFDLDECVKAISSAYRNHTEGLDESVMNRLISRILIGEVKKVDGQKVQEVRIICNFVGEISKITE